MKKVLSKFAQWMDGLKDRKNVLIGLIVLDFFMAILSNIVDWHWLMSVDWYLRPFTPICSLFPLTLAIWFTFYFFKKKIPAWYTSFIFIGIISYGVMSVIYFPLYMAEVAGFQWRIVGNMFWVITYALQSFIIASELKPVKIYQFGLIISYFLFKDYSDRYLGSFIDTLQPSFPEWLKDFLGMSMLTIHVVVFSFAAWLARKNQTFKKRIPEMQPQETSI